MSCKAFMTCQQLQSTKSQNCIASLLTCHCVVTSISNFSPQLYVNITENQSKTKYNFHFGSERTKELKIVTTFQFKYVVSAICIFIIVNSCQYSKMIESKLWVKTFLEELSIKAFFILKSF